MMAKLKKNSGRKKKRRIKICGMTRKEDVDYAASLGVDALGFILAESPRKIEVADAVELSADLPPFINRVAVVVNPNRELLDKIVESGVFDYIQFHGNEEVNMIQSVPLKTIKAISISDSSDLKEIEKYSPYADFLLFDTKIGEQTGGTGKAFDWSLLAEFNLKKKFILAGGLGPKNIELALETLDPPAVDINSRIEISPGIKEHKLMEEVVSKIFKF